MPRVRLFFLRNSEFFVGLMLALTLGAAVFLATSCTASSLLAGTRAVQIGTRTTHVPVVSDPAVQAHIDGFAAEMQARIDEYIRQRDEAIASGASPPPEPKLNWQQIVTALLTGGGAYVAARRSAAAKDESNLEKLAVALAPLLATPSERRTPTLIAATLTEALPGEASVTLGEAKAAA